MKQLGTLGGGNHFIEVCLDTENIVWLMLHSGSRNIGRSWLNVTSRRRKTLDDLNFRLPILLTSSRDTPEFAAYWKDLKWAQTYAMKNREIMMTRLLKVVQQDVQSTSMSMTRSKSQIANRACRQLSSQLRRARRALW